MKILIFLLTFFIGFVGYAMPDEKSIYGYVEKAILLDKNLVLSAKLDTGARSASLSAIHIHEVVKNNKIYMSYIVPSKNGDIEFFSEYVGKVRIKVRASESILFASTIEPIKRPVISLKVRLGNKERLIRVNLTNRKRFNYPLLLGREAIKQFNGIVDPSLVFTLKFGKSINEIK